MGLARSTFYDVAPVRVGAPLTLITLALGTLWLSL